MGDVVKNIDNAFIYIIGISVVLLTGITFTMIFFTVKYRRSKNPEPADIRGNWKLELVWTIIPLLIALSMFYVGWNSYLGLRNVPKGAMEIDVLAMQFSWLFKYPGGRESANLLVVPEGKAVKLTVTSDDVIHSLYIPSFRVKIDAVKGMKTYAWFQAARAGNYDIFCAEYCGLDHSKMSAILRIVKMDEYRRWLEKKN